MTDLIIPLLDHSNKENIQNFNDISLIFFKEYNKNKGYIDIKTLEKLINKIKDHFFKKSFGIIKLKILISLIKNYESNKLKIINTIIDNIIEINIKKIFELLSNDNKIFLENFKNIVVLLLLCIIDSTIDTEKNNDVLLLPYNNDDDDDTFYSELLNLDSDSDSDSKSVTLDELIETIITDILSNFNDDIIKINELKKSILDFFENVMIEDKKLLISNDDIDIFLVNNNINNEKYIKKIKIKHLLVNFITHILDKNNVL